MKGFIKILEAIIASLILLVSLTFFFTPTSRESSWDEALLQISAQDAIASMYTSGNLAKYIETGDYPNFNLKLFTLLPRTADFFAEISGIPKPQITAACVCTAAELAEFKSKIPSPDAFFYKNRRIIILYKPISDPAELGNSDILLYLQHTAELTANKSAILNHLRNGKGVVVASDLSKSQAEDGLMDSVFNLSWNGANGDNKGYVIGNENPSSMPFNLAKYYLNLTGNNNLEYNDLTGINSIDIDAKTVAADINNFVSYMKLNKFLGGRSVWSAQPQNDEAYLLIKASFMWASGERFVFGEKKEAPPNARTFKFLVYDSDPYEVILHIWRVFL